MSEKKLIRKSDFHMTICCVSNEDRDESLAAFCREQGINREQVEEKFFTLFNSFNPTHPIKLDSYHNEFRYITDEKRGREAVVICCRSHTIERFFDEIRKTFRVPMPTQPPHVTLYTLDGKLGIHIPSNEVMKSFPHVLLANLEEAFKTLGA